MQQIINFVIRNKTFLLFLLLFSISIALTIQSHSYHKSKFINSSNAISGAIYGASHSVSQYFELKEKNTILIEENKILREALYNNESKASIVEVENLTFDSKKRYQVTTAEVYKNSYNLTNNYILINKGLNDSIKQDFGAITSKGIVGIVDYTSGNYATVLSILSEKSRINAKLKSTNHSGSLVWNNESPFNTQLVDVSAFAPVKIGDTIVTGGQSAIFPKNINIGTVERFEVDTNGDSYTIEVKLFNDMTNLGTVYVIEHLDKVEIQALEEKQNE